MGKVGESRRMGMDPRAKRGLNPVNPPFPLPFPSIASCFFSFVFLLLTAVHSNLHQTYAILFSFFFSALWPVLSLSFALCVWVKNPIPKCSHKPELYSREELKVAKRIANPGCFATSMQMLLAPLMPYLDPKNPPTVFAASGYSGAGTKTGPKDADGKSTTIAKVVSTFVEWTNMDLALYLYLSCFASLRHLGFFCICNLKLSTLR